MQVSKGNFVVMKGKQAENNLFHLVGEKVSSESSVMDNTKNMDATRLWHLQLGHTFKKNLETWLAHVEVETRKKLKVLRSDNDGEFTSGNFKAFCSSKGVHHHYTTPGDPESNRAAERMNRTLLEKVQCKDKLDPRATKGSLLGYTDGIKGYRI
ncbi:hypothetical protein L6452_19948 [Arctium lappa]|uniref:Uncharacterized protein n=1 Tax=Arctium lappa TaxID=4217 RepID=A0ACB9BBV2_ARCLA|nr:hypothetical protein L6452_19948 [Arctium lappa]